MPHAAEWLSGGTRAGLLAPGPVLGSVVAAGLARFDPKLARGGRIWTGAPTVDVTGGKSERTGGE